MSANLPKGTRNMAALKRNDVLIQLNKTASIESSFPITGSAMLTDEPTRGKRNEARAATKRTALLVTVSVMLFILIYLCRNVKNLN